MMTRMDAPMRAEAPFVVPARRPASLDGGMGVVVDDVVGVDLDDGHLADPWWCNAAALAYLGVAGVVVLAFLGGIWSIVGG